SMPMTFAVSERSKFVTMRLSISSGERPLYCHTIATTGRSMYGKMSTGIVVIEMPPRIATSSAITTKVYGRLSASRTIHMAQDSDSEELRARDYIVRDEISGSRGHVS